MKKNIFACIGLIMLATACASIKAAPESQDQEAKNFNPVPNKGVIYIFRDEDFGSALHKEVKLNGKTLGETGPKSFFRVVVTPGKCVIDSNGESKRTLTVKAGDVYYVWQEIKMGLFSGSSQLETVPATRGRQGVIDSKLIQSKTDFICN